MLWLWRKKWSVSRSINKVHACFCFEMTGPGSGMTRCMVSQWYGNGITMVSKWCHNGVTMLSQWCRRQANNLHQRIIHNIVPSVHWIWNQNFTRTFVPKHYCKDGKLSVEVLEGWRIQIVPWQLIPSLQYANATLRHPYHPLFLSLFHISPDCEHVVNALGFGLFGIQVFLVHLWIFSQAVINYLNIKCDLKAMPMHCKFNQITD